MISLYDINNLSDEERIELLIELTASTSNSQLLTQLSIHKNQEVRFQVALNSNTPINILTALSGDEDWEMRYQVAINSSTSINILTELAKDKEAIVRRTAVRRLKNLAK